MRNGGPPRPLSGPVTFVCLKISKNGARAWTRISTKFYTRMTPCKQPTWKILKNHPTHQKSYSLPPDHSPSQICGSGKPVDVHPFGTGPRICRFFLALPGRGAAAAACSLRGRRKLQGSARSSSTGATENWARAKGEALGCPSGPRCCKNSAALRSCWAWGWKSTSSTAIVGD